MFGKSILKLVLQISYYLVALFPWLVEPNITSLITCNDHYDAHCFIVWREESFLIESKIKVTSLREVGRLSGGHYVVLVLLLFRGS